MDLCEFENNVSGFDGLLIEEGVVKMEPKKEVTILLLGETGVGKSTFINAIVNYFLFENMTEAAKNLKCVIPTSFALYDRSIMAMKECLFGDPDENECADKTKSSTQSCRSYNIDIGDYTLRFIDTPGIADCRGVEQDQFNMKNILNFLSNFKELNAIFVLLKPNNARVSVLFKYCILELLTHLSKSAADNILFLFTNARGTFYQPGDTAKALDAVLENIRLKPPHVEIKFNHDNSFCFDNESFRYLVAVTEPNNIVFDTDVHADFEKSWLRSVSECRRLFKRIVDIKPHAVQDTISINHVKSKIINLRKPIALIVENISKEINLCQKHEKKIEEFCGDIEDLEKELYTPTLDIITEQLKNPITVCSDPACCEKVSFNNISKLHYKSICHKPCYLDNSDGNIVGNAALLDCQAFNKYERVGDRRWFDRKSIHPDVKVEFNARGYAYDYPTKRTKSETCFVCSHTYLVHVTINYETKFETKQVRDDSKQKRIESNKQNIDARQYQIDTIKAKVKDLKEELRFITECSAYFARFLMANAITPFNDALEDYIKFRIANEQKGGGDSVVIDGLNDMLKSYAREKEDIEKLFKESRDKAELTSDAINAKIEQLVKLKHYGSVIKHQMELEAQAQVKAVAVFEKTITVGTEKRSGLSKFLSQIFKRKLW